MLATPPVLLHANYSPKAAIPRSLQECAAKSFSWSIPTTGQLRSARSAFSGSAPASPPACSCRGARRLAGASAFPVRLGARRLLRIRCVRLTPLTFRSPAARLPERRVSSASSQAPSLCFANTLTRQIPKRLLQPPSSVQIFATGILPGWRYGQGLRNRIEG